MARAGRELQGFSACELSSGPRFIIENVGDVQELCCHCARKRLHYIRITSAVNN